MNSYYRLQNTIIPSNIVGLQRNNLQNDIQTQQHRIKTRNQDHAKYAKTFNLVNNGNNQIYNGRWYNTVTEHMKLTHLRVMKLVKLLSTLLVVIFENGRKNN